MLFMQSITVCVDTLRHTYQITITNTQLMIVMLNKKIFSFHIFPLCILYCLVSRQPTTKVALQESKALNT